MGLVAAQARGEVDGVRVSGWLVVVGGDARSHEITGILGVGGILVLGWGSSLGALGSRGRAKRILSLYIFACLDYSLSAGLGGVASQS